MEFTLVFGSMESVDRFEFEKISTWLTGHQDYQWLQICQPDLDHVQYRCLVTEMTPISVGWLPYAFKATVTCDCPYAYGHYFENTYDISGSQKFVFSNRGSVREYFKPDLLIHLGSGATDVKIINHTDADREFSLAGLPAGDIDVIVDNKCGIIRDSNGEYNLYRFFNLNFFRLLPGDNDLEVVGDCTLKISGRFLHNIGG